MSEWKKYRRREVIEARPYVPGEDLSEVGRFDPADEIKDDDMIIRTADNNMQWLISKENLENIYEPVGMNWQRFLEAAAREVDRFRCENGGVNVKLTKESIFSDTAPEPLAGKKLVISIGNPEAFETDKEEEEDDK